MITELITQQKQFEKERVGVDGFDLEHPVSLWDYNANISGYMVDRIKEELDELNVAVTTPESVNDQLAEVADVVILCASVASHIIEDNNLPSNSLEEMIQKKMQRNFAKYAPENFFGKPIAQGLQDSRDLWGLSHPEGSGWGLTEDFEIDTNGLLLPSS